MTTIINEKQVEVISFIRNEFSDLVSCFNEFDEEDDEGEIYHIAEMLIGDSTLWLEFYKEKFCVVVWEDDSEDNRTTWVENNYDHQDLKKFIEDNIYLTLTDVRKHFVKK